MKQRNRVISTFQKNHSSSYLRTEWKVAKLKRKQICYVDIVIILSIDDSDMNPERTGEDERINMIISRDVLLKYSIE